MPKATSLLVPFLVLLQSISSANSLQGQNIDLSTPGNAADWLITAAGAVNAPSFQSNVNRPGTITLIDNSLISGNFVSGASVNQYNGYWHAENSFQIPAGATNIQFDFEDLWANDRVVLSLNSVDIGNATFGGGTGAGLMRFDENGSDQAYTFDETVSGSINTGFNVGGTNVLRMTVNNTGINLAAPTVASWFPLDGTVAHLPTATVSFTSIPEPSSGFALFAGVNLLMGYRRRRR